MGQFALDRPEGLVIEEGMPMLENMGKLMGMPHQLKVGPKAAKAKDQ